jgi:hypothetical protein
MGWTALIRASSNGHTEIVEILLRNGADVYAKDNTYHRTALDWALNASDENDLSEEGHTKIIKMLEDAIEVRGNKQEAMELVRQRDVVKIPPLFNFARGQIPTSEISTLKEYEFPRKKLGGKRKTRKSKKSRRRTRKRTRKH